MNRKSHVPQQASHSGERARVGGRVRCILFFMNRLSQPLGSHQLWPCPPCAHSSDTSPSSHALRTLLCAWSCPGLAHPPQLVTGGEDGGMKKTGDHSDPGGLMGKDVTKGMPTHWRQTCSDFLSPLHPLGQWKRGAREDNKGTHSCQNSVLALASTLVWSAALSGPPLIGKIIRSVQPASQGSHRVPGSGRNYRV